MTAIRRIFLLVLLCSIIPLGVFAQADISPTTLLMTFIPNIQFAPTYVAMEAGYFAEADFDVTVEYLDEPLVVDLVAANENQFGIVSGEQVILAASQGRPVVYVYEWFQEYPIGIVYSADLEVESMTDLAGMRVGIPGRFGASYNGLTTLLQAADMSETDINLEEIGYVAPEVFCVGAVDASVVYSNNEPLQIRNRAQAGDCGDVTDVGVLPVAAAADLVSNGIITNQEMIANNPDEIIAFVSAYDAALALTINNPARAYLLSAPYIEGLSLDDDFRTALELAADAQDEFLATNPERQAITESRITLYENLAVSFDADTLLQFQILLASIELWDAEQLGYTDAESWLNMQDTLLALGQLDAAIELESLYSNEFLPEGD